MKRILSYFMAALLVVTLPSCAALKGALIGTGSGAAVGAGIGAAIGDGKGAAIGAAVGAAVGSTVGSIIGAVMDKKAKELEEVAGAEVETVTDVNGLEAIKVTFDSGILFATNSATLSNESKTSLKDFATKMADLEDTDITIWGHTDNTGTYEVNQRVSNNRASSVQKYLNSCGIANERMTAEGKSYDMPVADNGTVEGRAQNRRVEIYISANSDMVKAAENGEIKIN
ncbi:MAG: OmpA family protein [Bacteroidales bacterium]|nr:OmpA family protein [Candidatus Cryptobacteroides caccocaballi]